MLVQAAAQAGQREAGAPQLYATGIAKQIAGDEEPARRDFDALQADPASWQARLELENSIAAKKADAN